MKNLKRFQLEQKNYDFKYVSLFSGMGGFEKALDALGGECILSCEIDKHARNTYSALFPTHKIVEDVKKINEKELPDHDVLVGGFPCQAFSQAGKQLAFEDDRGQLYLEIVRIAKEKQPKLLLLENVKGILGVQKGKVLEVILKAFRGAGYTMFFKTLDSKNFSLAQQRQRVIFMGVRNDLVEQEYDELFEELYTFEEFEKITLLDVLEKDVDEKHFVAKEEIKDYREGTSKLKRDLIFVGGYGNLWVDSPNGVYSSKNFRQGNRIYDARGLATTLTAQMSSGLGKKTTMYLVPDEWSKNGMNIRGLTVEECFRLQGFDPKDVEKARDNGVSDAQLYKQTGNAVSTHVIYAAMHNLCKKFLKERE